MTPELEARYAEPHRHYHTRRHIEQCLQFLDLVPDLTDGERRTLTWAIWWHDAVYDPHAADNEVQSAALAKQELKALGATLHERDEVARLILLTAGHEVEEGDRLGELLVSIDLSILAAPPQVYDLYAAAVRAEYAFVPEPAWRAGRAAILQRFLAAPVIYPDPDFRTDFEAPARANLERELATLD
jgi:predicted metal-dependent HD superfamily phosphohydrolase